MRICRKLFIVPLADDSHGKSTMMTSLQSQGRGVSLQKAQKGAHQLTSPWGRIIDSFIYVRSFQEVEKPDYKTVVDALTGNDANWHQRELIVMPSHASNGALDTMQMISAAHAAGFDAICVSLILNDKDGYVSADYREIWGQNWDERWTLPNPENDDWKGQVDALGRDLWAWICQALAS